MKTLGASKCLVHIVWNPPWGPHLISEQGKKILGIGNEPKDEDDDLAGEFNPPER